MKTKLLPLAALLSLTAMTSVQAAPYVTDGYGNIARDSFGECVRTSTWTQADAALCTAPEASSAAKNAAANNSKTA